MQDALENKVTVYSLRFRILQYDNSLESSENGANKNAHDAFWCTSPTQHKIHDERQKTITAVSEPKYTADEHLWT